MMSYVYRCFFCLLNDFDTQEHKQQIQGRIDALLTTLRRNHKGMMTRHNRPKKECRLSSDSAVSDAVMVLTSYTQAVPPPLSSSPVNDDGDDEDSDNDMNDEDDDEDDDEYFDCDINGEDGEESESDGKGKYDGVADSALPVK